MLVGLPMSARVDQAADATHGGEVAAVLDHCVDAVGVARCGDDRRAPRPCSRRAAFRSADGSRGRAPSRRPRRAPRARRRRTRRRASSRRASCRGKSPVAARSSRNSAARERARSTSMSTSPTIDSPSMCRQRQARPCSWRRSRRALLRPPRLLPCRRRPAIARQSRVSVRKRFLGNVYERTQLDVDCQWSRHCRSSRPS